MLAAALVISAYLNVNLWYIKNPSLKTFQRPEAVALLTRRTTGHSSQQAHYIPYNWPDNVR